MTVVEDQELTFFGHVLKGWRSKLDGCVLFASDTCPLVSVTEMPDDIAWTSAMFRGDGWIAQYDSVGEACVFGGSNPQEALTSLEGVLRERYEALGKMMGVSA